MRARRGSMIAALLLATAGCGVPNAAVHSTRPRQNDPTGVATSTPSREPSTDVPQGTTPDTTPATTPDTTPLPVEQGIIDFGANHQPQPYDGVLTAAFKDIESFWAVKFPEVYGSDFKPLSGKIYAAYPDRSDPIPGCGSPQ